MPVLIDVMGAQRSKQHTAIVYGEQALRFIPPGLEMIELLEPGVRINSSKINNYFS